MSKRKTKTEEFAELAHNGISEAQSKIETLQLKAKLAEAEGRQEMERQIKSLEERKAELKEKLENLKSSGHAASETLLEGCRDSWRRFNDAIDAATDTLSRKS